MWWVFDRMFGGPPLWAYPFLDQLDRIENTVSANQDKIDALATQLGKVQGEVTDAIADLKDQLANGEELDFSALDAAAQSLDDINPDVVGEEPETPGEPEEPQV